MIVDRRNIYLWYPEYAGKYSPSWDKKRYNQKEQIYVDQYHNDPGFSWDKFRFYFKWNLETEFEEKKLRSYDFFCENKSLFAVRGFFIHDWVLECWHDLVGRDIEIIPAECYTKNGPVKEFHFVYIKHEVDGIDEALTVYHEENESFRHFPKANNDFMEGHHLAIQKTLSIYIYAYITPELKARTFVQARRYKEVWSPTFNIYWDSLCAWEKESKG